MKQRLRLITNPFDQTLCIAEKSLTSPKLKLTKRSKFMHIARNLMRSICGGLCQLEDKQDVRGGFFAFRVHPRLSTVDENGYLLSFVDTRVTRLGKISPFGQLFTLGIF
jgi:hypothetical protein